MYIGKGGTGCKGETGGTGGTVHKRRDWVGMLIQVRLWLKCDRAGPLV
jgi:hypothetical protein